MWGVYVCVVCMCVQVYVSDRCEYKYIVYSMWYACVCGVCVYMRYECGCVCMWLCVGGMYVATCVWVVYITVCMWGVYVGCVCVCVCMWGVYVAVCVCGRF